MKTAARKTKAGAKARAGRRNNNRRALNRKAMRDKRRAQTLGRLGIQPSLKVGETNDKHEQEADKVARHVVNSPAPVNQSDGAKSKSPVIQKKNAPAVGSGAFTADIGVARNVAAIKRAGGQPLPANERAFLEPRFGRDLGHVRVHNDDRAAKTSRSIQARAFTVENHIAFNKGEFRPGTHEGRKLLAHEITHTIQQTGGTAEGRGAGPSAVQRNYDKDYKTKYHANLRRALNLILKGNRRQRGNRFGTIFKHAHKLGHWRVERRKVGNSQVVWPFMILNKGSKPSEGLFEIANNLDKIKYECAQTLTMARLYAHMLTMGPAEYDRRMGHLSKEFRFSFLMGTGLKKVQWYRRSRINGPMEVIRGGRKYTVKESGNTLRDKEANLVRNIPLGSRVNWRNTDPSIPEHVAYKMENALLMEKKGAPSNYVYAAHPYGFVSSDKIINSLLASAQYKQHKNSRREGIYLYEIEVPDTAITREDQKKKKVRIGGEDFEPSL